MSDILLVSPDGMLGRAFLERFALRGTAISTIAYPAIDLRDEASIARALGGRPQVVLNCSAWTDVDLAETREADAAEVNGHGVGRLARACASIGATLVHFGTDYVFDGRATEPYPVDAPIDPQGAYGRTKALGERLLRESGARHLLIRTSWLYAPWAKNFVKTIATIAAQRDELKVVDDQRGRPTSAEGLAETTMALLEAGHEGTFHATDSGECTWFELARFIVEHQEARARVVPCSSDEFARAAKRPAYSVLALEKTHALAPPRPDWKLAVADVLARLEP